MLFLDPYGTEVEWSTIKRIASFNALDTWILFPLSGIARMLQTKTQLDNIDRPFATRLNKIYGGDSWQQLYSEVQQATLFGGVDIERNPGTNGLLRIYREQLSGLFGNRFLKKSRTFRNSKNSPLYEFLFCAGNPKGAPIAKKIAKHILEHL